MIFAHVGLATDGDYVELDYSKSCEKVYIDFSLFAVRNEGWATVLENVGDPKSNIRRGLPSWCPDWSSPIPLSPRFPKHRFPIQIAHDYDYRVPSRIDESDPTRFSIKMFDVIDFVSPEIRIAQIPTELRHNLASALSNINVPDLLDDENLQLHCKVYISGNPLAEFAEVYQVWDSVVNDTNMNPLPHSQFKYHPDNDGASVAMFLKLACREDNFDYVSGKALAWTRHRRLALVPVASRKGDLIVPLRPELYGREGFYKMFVFHPLPPATNDSITLSVSTQKIKTTKTPVVSCEYVGGCFRDGNLFSMNQDRISLQLQ
jgi:hypothetical protein